MTPSRRFVPEALVNPLNANEPGSLSASPRSRRRRLEKARVVRKITRAKIIGWWVHTYFEGHEEPGQWFIGEYFFTRRGARKKAAS